MFPYHHSTADSTQDHFKSKKEDKKSRRRRNRTPIPTTPKHENFNSTFPALVEQKSIESRRSRRRKATNLSPDHGATSCSPMHTDDDDEYYGIGCVNRATSRTPKDRGHLQDRSQSKTLKPRKKKKKRAVKHDDIIPSFMTSFNYNPSFYERPTSPAPSGFQNRDSPLYKGISHRHSYDNMYGERSTFGLRSPHEPSAARAFELPPLSDELRCRYKRRPSKLPPIVRDSHDEKRQP